jgi:peroxiredoxin
MPSLLRSIALAAALLTTTVAAHADPGGSSIAPLAAPPWMGVSMDGGGPNGVAVEHVVRNSPADKGGFKQGDKIVSVDGAKVSAPGDVTGAVGKHQIGDTVNVAVDRAGSSVKLQVVLAQRPTGDEMLRMDLVGAFAPAFTNVKALTGAPSTLASLKGQVVLLDFWAGWCGPCRAAAPRISLLKDRYGAQGLAVVGVTTDAEEKAAVNAERFQMRYPSVVDKAGDTTKSYGIVGLPTMLLIDKRGVVREVFVGFDPSGEARIEAVIKTLLAEPAPSSSP